jgi:hypothetical protein
MGYVDNSRNFYRLGCLRFGKRLIMSLTVHRPNGLYNQLASYVKMPDVSRRAREKEFAALADGGALAIEGIYADLPLANG